MLEEKQRFIRFFLFIRYFLQSEAPHCAGSDNEDDYNVGGLSALFVYGACNNCVSLPLALHMCLLIAISGNAAGALFYYPLFQRD